MKGTARKNSEKWCRKWYLLICLDVRSSRYWRLKINKIIKSAKSADFQIFKHRLMSHRHQYLNIANQNHFLKQFLPKKMVSGELLKVILATGNHVFVQQLTTSFCADHSYSLYTLLCGPLILLIYIIDLEQNMKFQVKYSS